MSKKIDRKRYADNAGAIMEKWSKEGIGITLTKTKIRSFLSMMNELYEMVRVNNSEKLSQEVISKIQYTKMKYYYEIGRDRDSTKNTRYKCPCQEFFDRSEFFEYLDGIGDSREELIYVCHYMEALVAYHKYYRTQKD